MKKFELIRKAYDLEIDMARDEKAHLIQSINLMTIDHIDENPDLNDDRYWDTEETSTVDREKSVFNICIPDGSNNDKFDLGKISQAYNTFKSKAEEDHDMYFYNLTQDEFWQVLEILFD